MRKYFLIFFIVMAVTTALSCITLLFINPAFDDVVIGFSTLLFMAVILLYYLGMIVCSIGSNVVIAVRFYKSCYTDEGYLTHTLPVNSNQLLIGKTIAYFLFSLIMGALMVLSVLLIIGTGFAHFGTFVDLSSIDFSELTVAMKEETGIDLIPFILFLIVYCIVISLANILIITGCISIGQLMSKHRILGALLAYFGFYMIVQIVSTFASIPMTTSILKAELSGTTMTMWEVLGPVYLLVGGLYVVIAAIMYFINIHMMTKRLNLE
ncbi:MAG: hypothetical protein E7290_02895 [Lachnospiraceae bacterium]|nr:hypothetical protein [Lachnospiraceae bacterium]